MQTLTKRKKPRQFDTDNLSGIVQAIDAKRDSLGISVSSLETGGVISQGLWGRVVRGQRTPTLSTLAAMAEAVGMKLSLVLEDA